MSKHSDDVYLISDSEVTVIFCYNLLYELPCDCSFASGLSQNGFFSLPYQTDMTDKTRINSI